MAKQKYPTKLKIKVIKEYKKGDYGYKKLAKKYKLNRDLVRYWVLKSKIKRDLEAQNKI